MMSQTQVHSKFKVFTGKLGADHSLGDLAHVVSDFVQEHNVAAKSIGVEFLEASGQLVLTLGYAENEPGYAVRLQAVPLGKTENLSVAGSDFSALEQAMAEAAAKVGNIICHELYITDDHDFVMVFLTRK